MRFGWIALSSESWNKSQVFHTWATSSGSGLKGHENHVLAKSGHCSALVCWVFQGWELLLLFRLAAGLLAQFIRPVFMSLNNASCVWVYSPPQHFSGQPLSLYSGQRQNNTQSFVLGPGSWLQRQWADNYPMIKLEESHKISGVGAMSGFSSAHKHFSPLSVWVAPKQDSVLSQTDYILDVSAERSTLKDGKRALGLDKLVACILCPPQSLFCNVTDASFLQMQIPATLSPHFVFSVSSSSVWV